ncbi:MAG: tetratricopeptide repeat protein [Acidobacteriaceae bacterium]
MRTHLQKDAAALAKLQAAAQGGDAKAQYMLGVMYDNGQGAPQDFAQAVSWFRKATEQGEAKAQYNLGVMYDTDQRP